jgi:SpoVK/Ycf46/Vps4 family AAA+-type ATPase
MAKNIFHQRGKALEDEFFFKVDQELIAQLEERYVQQEIEQSLKESTGIVDQHVLQELRSVEITPRSLAAFSMFPAVFVAWSDGHIEAAERDAILKAAKHQGIYANSPSYELLEHWLAQRPSSELEGAWKDFIHAIRTAISDRAFRELRGAAIERAESIAKAAGGFLGIGSVSHAERTALAELHEVFDDAIESAEPVDCR